MAFSSFNSMNSYMSFIVTTISSIFVLTFPSIDSSMSVYYPFDTSSNGAVANYATKTAVYNGTLATNTALNSTVGNYVSGTSALYLNNTVGGAPNSATKYIESTTAFNTNSTAGMTISCWFNPTTLPATGQIAALFDLANTANSKGITVNLSESNMIYSGYYQ